MVKTRTEIILLSREVKGNKSIAQIDHYKEF